tara:strand:- start:33 stop:533 length:501 start_codon:yes stop_codon:yes gene_type:complete
MADEATPKKKNKLTGCLMLYVKLIGGFFGLGIVVIIIGSIFDGALQKGCNEGKAEDCQSLLESTSVTASFDPEQITNEEFKPKFVEKVAKLKAEEAARKERAALREINTLLMVDCQKQLKAAMKDPDSFKVHSRNLDALQIEYSGTNAFGARIRNVMDCKTGKNLR